MMLYTLQKQGHDVTANHAPTDAYLDPYGPYWHIGLFLGWESWIWAFMDIQDFNNDWLQDYAELRKRSALWVLDAPADAVRWMGLERQCATEKGPVESMFFDAPLDARQAGDIPQALIKRPIPVEWVKRVLKPE